MKQQFVLAIFLRRLETNLYLALGKHEAKYFFKIHEIDYFSSTEKRLFCLNKTFC